TTAVSQTESSPSHFFEEADVYEISAKYKVSVASTKLGKAALEKSPSLSEKSEETVIMHLLFCIAVLSVLFSSKERKLLQLFKTKRTAKIKKIVQFFTIFLFIFFIFIFSSQNCKF
ncbi:hypothetical protein, partial [Treponema sp. UBA7567]|uniref:hypothetical protein n=1 Tax=Treponema sp. UBA7567 TaxID=1947748 RepID=UPI0025E42DF3